MLADQLDYVIGVDPHRDAHALAIVDVRSGGIVLETGVGANSGGARPLAPQLLEQPGVGPLAAAYCPGPIAAGSEARPPSLGSPAAHRSLPRPDRRSVTASTAAATGSSTARCT